MGSVQNRLFGGQKIRKTEFRFGKPNFLAVLLATGFFLWTGDQGPLCGGRAFKHRRLATFCLKAEAFYLNMHLTNRKNQLFCTHMFISLRNRLTRGRKISPKANSLRHSHRGPWSSCPTVGYCEPFCVTENPL